MVKDIIGFMAIVFLSVIICYCIICGFDLKVVQVLPYNSIGNIKTEYEKSINDYYDIVNQKYPNAIAALENSKNEFERNKEEYAELKQYNSYEKLLEAAREKQFNIEWLWIRLGLLAKNNDLQSQLVLKSEDNNQESTSIKGNIEFTLNGSYLAVKNYIYDILIDLDLRFRAENIVIVPNGADKVTATFTVENVNIVL